MLRRLWNRLNQPATRTDILLMALAVIFFVFMLTIFGVGQR